MLFRKLFEKKPKNPRLPSAGTGPDDTKTPSITIPEAIKKFKILQVDEKSQTYYPILVVGNAPIIKKLDKHKVSSGKIALVGVGGMRNLQIACEVGTKDAIPFIMIVDNSKYVHSFWYLIKNNAVTNKTANGFLKGLKKILDENKSLYANNADLSYDHLKKFAHYPNQNIPKFFSDLITQYSYDYIRSIIQDTLLIQQSWADKETFSQINNILNALNIPPSHRFAFPSNVAPYLAQQKQFSEAAAVIQNVARFKASHAFYSNLAPIDKGEYQCTKVFHVSNQSVDAIKASEIFKHQPFPALPRAKSLPNLKMFDKAEAPSRKRADSFPGSKPSAK